MEIQGWVLYDDACGFCRRWVPFWASTLRRRGFDIAPLQSAWVRDSVTVADGELLDDLRLLLRAGASVVITGRDKGRRGTVIRAYHARGRCRGAATRSAGAATALGSGPLSAVSGVGTQIVMASTSANAA